MTQGSGANALGKAGYWYQTPNSYNIDSKISKNIGKHYVKAGGEYRRDNTNAARPQYMRFDFSSEFDCQHVQQPEYGAQRRRLGQLSAGRHGSSSYAASIPIQRPRNNFFALFVQDDFKISQRLTLNLGLRYEYYGPMKDPDHRLSRFLDLTAPIPEFQGANAPQLPAAATALRTSAPDLQRRLAVHATVRIRVRGIRPRRCSCRAPALPGVSTTRRRSAPALRATSSRRPSPTG